MGDTTDNIPGVPGIGEKTATDLIGAYGSLDELYDRLREIPRESLRRKLEQHRASAFLSPNGSMNEVGRKISDSIVSINSPSFGGQLGSFMA